MVILTLNCGSSSVKYQVYDWVKQEVLGKGVLERVGQVQSDLEHESLGKKEYKDQRVCPTHKEAVAWVMEILLDKEYGCLSDIKEVTAVGHRVVHGGSKFTKSVKINQEVLEEFKSIESLAPLHNPANFRGIEAAMAVLPDVPHCAVLDTAWHQTMPEVAYTYAVPHEWKEKYGVRRYGFHGTSFLYTSKRAAVLLGKSATQCNLIICHIGNGASMCAVCNGISVDTSMGMTPLEGLVMGTRSGDIDPAVVSYMVKQTGKSAADIDTELNKKSGLMGVTGQFSDRRDIEKGIDEGNTACTLAHNMETYRLRKYIGAYVGALGVMPDALVFTAGVGEFDASVRLHTLQGLECMGIKIDPKKNNLARTRNAETCISTDESVVKIFVIPTDEELVMTEDTYALMNGTYDVHTKYAYSFAQPSYVNKARETGLSRDMQRLPGLDKIIAKPKG